MAREIGIVFSAKDRYSDTILKIKQNQAGLRTSTKELQRELDTLTKGRAQIQLDMTKAKRELADAKKAAKEAAEGIGDITEAEKRLGEAQENYNTIESNLKAVTKAAKETEKAMEDLANTESRISNRGGSGGGSGGEGGLVQRIVSAGAIKEVGSLASELLTQGIANQYGDIAGNYAGSILSGIASGAAIGSMIAPGIGTAIGGILGAGAGYLQGWMAEKTQESDAQKDYVQDLYEAVMQGQADALESGTVTAANREMYAMAFGTMFGDQSRADAFLADLLTMANTTPFAYDELISSSRLMASAYDPDEILPNLEILGNARAAMGLSSSDMEMWIRGLSRMEMTGKTTQEYLNYFSERGIDVYSYLARAVNETAEGGEALLASGRLSKEEAERLEAVMAHIEEHGAITTKDIMQMVTEGLIPGAEAAEAILRYMGEDFSGAMDKQAQTYSGMVSTMEDAQDSLNARMGEGYTAARKQGLLEQTAFLEDERLGEAYEMIGMYQASLENEREEAIRSAVEDAMASSEYQFYKDLFEKSEARGNEEGMRQAGAQMGRIVAEAQAAGESEYMQGEGAQLVTETAIAVVDGIAKSAGDAYRNAGYDLGIRFTQGISDGILAGDTTPGSDLYHLTGASPFMTGSGYGRATGLSYVPYDGFPAVLHEGEAVLTASENRMRGGDGGNITISIGQMAVREEADVERIASVLAEKIALARMTAG